MILCDYINDLGIIFKRVKPKIYGIDTLNNQVISTSQILLQVSNWIDIDGYYEVDNKQATCQSRGRKRRLILQTKNLIFELEYYKPFTDLDWSIFNSEDVKIETIPEFINNGDLKLMLKDFP